MLDADDQIAMPGGDESEEMDVHDGSCLTSTLRMIETSLEWFDAINLVLLKGGLLRLLLSPEEREELESMQPALGVSKICTVFFNLNLLSCILNMIKLAMKVSRYSSNMFICGHAYLTTSYDIQCLFLETYHHG